MTYKLIDKEHDIKVPYGMVKNFVDNGLYQRPQKRGYLKSKLDEFVDIDLVREFANYDGPIRTNTTFYFTYMDDDGHSWPAQPHTDVISCIATHAIPLDYHSNWKYDWGGSLYLYREDSISDEYKEIMPKLNVENPKQEDIDSWNELKKWEVNFELEYELDLTNTKTVLFTRDTWHGVADVHTTGGIAYRRILIVNYHKRDMKCAFGD